jgi:hypothetical protein
MNEEPTRVLPHVTRFTCAAIAGPRQAASRASLGTACTMPVNHPDRAMPVHPSPEAGPGRGGATGPALAGPAGHELGIARVDHPVLADPVPLEYSIAWLSCAVACGLEAMMVG